MKTVHVIGATGHIGSYLCPMLVNSGYNVVGYSRGRTPLYSVSKEEYQYRNVVAERRDAIDMAIEEGADVICDLVAFTLDDAKYICDKLFASNKYLTTKLISIGSIWVYGDRRNYKVSEDDSREAKDEYGKNKSLMEKYLLEQNRINGLKVTILHPGHICGKGWLPVGPQGNRDINVISKIKNGEKIILPDDGNATLQHVHSLDVARLIIKAIEDERAIGEAFNIACNEPISLKEYANMLYHYYDNKPNIDFCEYNEFLLQLDNEDSIISKEHIDRSPHVSMKKAKQILNFEPIFTEQEAVLDGIEHWDRVHKKRLIDLAINNRNEWIEPVCKCTKNLKISVIIPAYYPKHLIEVVKHLIKIGDFYEIIIVDDSGELNPQNYSGIKHLDKVRIYYHERNLGRSAARNTGAVHAQGDIFLFLDQDMFLNPSFSAEARKYYEVNDSMIFLGLRETLSYEKLPSFEQWTSPDIYKDWRINVVVSPDFDDLTVLGIGNQYNKCKPFEEVHIDQRTKNLRLLGVSSESTIGFWDLPSMVVSHTMMISSKDFFRIGGFAEWIKGWGGEDIVVGFLSCAAGIPIKLSKIASYQASHTPYSGSQKAKVDELDKNLTYYRNWAKELEDFPKLDVDTILERGRLYQN